MRRFRAFFLLSCIFAFAFLHPVEPGAFARGVKKSYEASASTAPEVTQPIVILDAGHGGYDEGAKVNTLMEKKVTLLATNLVKKHLEELGYHVVMTRSRDTYVPLPRRVSIANKSKGSLFVSMHFNSCPNPEVKGIEVFYYDSKELWRTRASKRLASCVLQRLIQQTHTHSRGVKHGNFHVIRETQMPAVLVEGGFMTNKEERIKLRDRQYLDRLALGVAQGIDKYMKM
ncbi:MAG: N-acetylmuramoyl-L-alanine amidase [Chlamydiota bacterium]